MGRLWVGTGARVTFRRTCDRCADDAPARLWHAQTVFLVFGKMMFVGGNKAIAATVVVVIYNLLVRSCAPAPAAASPWAIV